MYALLIIVFVVVCVFLILVVLLQQGKGADVAAAFGGTSAPSAFGPRGTTTLMHRLTTGSFVGFVVLCMALTIMSASKGRSVTKGLEGKGATATPVAAAATPGTTTPAAAPVTSAPAVAPQASPATENVPAEKPAGQNPTK